MTAPELPIKLITEERAAAYAVLDQGLVAHVAFVLDGAPVCMPMVYARDGDRLLLHAARGGRFFAALADAAPVCLTVTELDGLVLAKSGLRHSVNYRAVRVSGRTSALEEHAAKARALHQVVEHVVPGRMRDARPANAKELAATGVLTLAMEHVSLKSRSGPPADLEGDRDRDCWAGVIPLRTQLDAPLPAGYNGDAPLPDYVLAYRRPQAPEPA